VVILIVMGTYTTIVFGYTRDLITAEKKLQVMNAGLEDRITERTFDLARANEEIQRFAYIVTHDLRAPLVNIMGFTSELDTSLAAVKGYIESADPAEREAAFPAAQAAAAEDLPEAIKFIRSSTRKMDGLINAILALAREGRRKLDPAALDLRALLEAAADSVRHQVIEAGGDIIIEGVAPSLESDRLALDQILGNLLDNAVKYRSDARPIRIHMRMHEGSGGRVVVEVQDNGRGISSQDHERVFELFRRSGRQDKPGEGIGLAHVRALARKLGGNITLVSELDRGSTFTLTIARDLRRVIQGASK
jgi:signal transduction histidine kinase